MITLRHRTASGDVSSCWEFCPVRQVVEAVFRVASGPLLELTIEVCATDRPRFGARPLMRLDGEAWRILPVRWRNAYVDAPIHESMGHGQLILTNAPAEVDAELEAL